MWYWWSIIGCRIEGNYWPAVFEFVKSKSPMERNWSLEGSVLIRLPAAAAAYTTTV